MRCGKKKIAWRLLGGWIHTHFEVLLPAARQRTLLDICILLLLVWAEFAATLKSPPHNKKMDKLGKLLASARASNVRSAAITLDQVSHLTSQQGYAVLHHTTESLQKDHGWKIVGWKVGATSAAVQQRIGLSEPFWGPIFSKTVLKGQRGEAVRFSIQNDLIRGIEAEFAFQIKRDIVPRAEPYSVQELMHEYCSTVTPCVEVCASRMLPDVQSNTPMLIGDTGNFTVIFPSPSSHQDLEAGKVFEELKHCKTSCNLDGKQIATGSGADVLGSPEFSLQWFANNVVNGERQLTIQAGEFVTTGATCGLIPITKPCYSRVYFSGVSKYEFDLAFRE